MLESYGLHDLMIANVSRVGSVPSIYTDPAPYLIMADTGCPAYYLHRDLPEVCILL